MQRRRAELGRGFYNGGQATENLGISRTTLGWWVKNGKVPKPAKLIAGVLLFKRKPTDRLIR